MPTLTDPLADAAESAAALRGLAHATRDMPPTSTYPVLGELIAGTRSLRQVLDQLTRSLVDAHELAVGVHVGLDTASGRMTSRRRPCATTGDGEAVFFEAPRLAKIGSALTFENLHALSFPLLSQPSLSLLYLSLSFISFSLSPSFSTFSLSSFSISLSLSLSLSPSLSHQLS